MMNEYRFRMDIPKEEYEQFVQSHQLCNLLQSYDWAKVKTTGIMSMLAFMIRTS